MKNSLWTRLVYAYWNLVPYQWRPAQILYRLKCWAWYRYSTVRPRWLGHMWIDRDDLLINIMFEVLGRFIEEEYPERVRQFEDKEPGAAELLELYDIWDWWINTYLIADERFAREFMTGIEQPKIRGVDTPEGPQEGESELARNSIFVFSSDEAHMKWAEATTLRSWADQKLQAELSAKLHRLIDLRKWMWT